jgi:glycine/D-amino acid oxidase-like deaminating enzyme
MPERPESKPPTRRAILQGAAALSLAGVGAFGLAGQKEESAMSETPTDPKSAPRGAARPTLKKVAVVGAGAFGGWTALHLLRRGVAVTLLDGWGPGNLRASSGGETRVIRGMYGADKIYVDGVVRSFDLWKDAERRWGRRFYHPTGVLWMFSVDDRYAKTSIPLLHAANLPVDELSIDEARRRFPQVRFDGVRSVYFEREAGYLTARLACQAVAEAFVAEGGDLRRVAARPGPIENGRLSRLDLADGGRIEADAYVFACGPWLGSLFPQVIGDGVLPTRQEVFYLGAPQGDRRYDEGTLPIWIDFSERIYYGIPGNLERGFKVADDTRGEPIDPTDAERSVTPARLAEAREVIARRFPEIAHAPMVGAEVCQYENSPDGHLIAGTHPEAGNLWILGGGSGHGFKLGPALGENAASWIFGESTPPELFSLGRLAEISKRKTQFAE